MTFCISQFRYLHSMKLRSLNVTEFKQKIRNIKNYSSASYAHCTSLEPLWGLTVSQTLDRSVERFPENDAIVVCHQNIRKNYTQYKNDIDNLATGLLALNVKKGDRIGIWSTNCYEWLLTQFASARLGLILVCINAMSQPREMKHCLDLSGLRVLVAGENFREIQYYPVLHELLPELDNCNEIIRSQSFPNLERIITFSKQRLPGTLSFDEVTNAGGSKERSELEQAKKRVQIHDPACIFFTSGTTGLPKGAVLSNHNVVNMSHFISKRSEFDDIEEKQRICSSTPLFHVQGGVFCSYAPVLSGHCFILPSPIFSARKSMEAIQAEKCNFLVGTPTMFIDILNHADFEKYDFSSIKKGITGGASATPEMIRIWRERIKNNKLLIGYGSSECTLGVMMCGINDDEHITENTVGRPMPHTEVKVVDEQGNVVAFDTPGQILVRGFATMLGYWNDEERTKQSFTNDRWFITGDIGTLDRYGYGRIVGRSSDLIIRGGENIYPKEVEDCLSTNAKISQVHVFGVPDNRLGEKVCAWVSLKGDQLMTEDEVKRYCKDMIASFKIPEYVKFVQDYPKLASGKVDKNTMKQQMVLELSK